MARAAVEGAGAWEQRVRPTAGGGEGMMREQLTGLAWAEEWKSWMLKRRAAEAGGGRRQRQAAAAGSCDAKSRESEEL